MWYYKDDLDSLLENEFSYHETLDIPTEFPGETYRLITLQWFQWFIRRWLTIMPRRTGLPLTLTFIILLLLIPIGTSHMITKDLLNSDPVSDE